MVWGRTLRRSVAEYILAVGRAPGQGLVKGCVTSRLPDHKQTSHTGHSGSWLPPACCGLMGPLRANSCSRAMLEQLLALMPARPTAAPGSHRIVNAPRPPKSTGSPPLTQVSTPPGAMHARPNAYRVRARVFQEPLNRHLCPLRLQCVLCGCQGNGSFWGVAGALRHQ